MAHLSASETPLRLRIAQMDDLDRLSALMQASISDLQQGFLDAAQIEGSFEFMGLDRQLITDGTYFVVEAGDAFAGCGGWSFRATLFGADHSTGRDARQLDPLTEPAKVRAMYTSPSFARRGVGRLVLSACEAAAAAAGFCRVELAGTLSGAPLYTACGYTVIEPFDAVSSKGVRIPLLRMGKAIGA